MTVVTKPYILMKASRLPMSGMAHETDAYCGATCEELPIPRGKVYSDLLEAVSDALALKQRNPVGWNIWDLGSERH